MNWHRARINRKYAAATVFLLVLISHPIQARSQGDDSSAQVMTRGPVHEAFAAPLVHNPQAGPVIAKQPPQAVEELPPDQKPAGANVQWIPGYWQWDQGRNDFLWISGVWREPPPGRQWVPGYWNQIEGGYQWAPGAWVAIPQSNAGPSQAATGSDQSLYLPAPPPTLEAGPSSPAPSAQVFWSPGSWSWLGARYAWRPGFWAAAQPGWVWMPAHFVWTPGGYLFVQGYWDLPIASRGLLFAPVYYPQPIYLQPGYVYSPSVGIMAPGFTANLFVQPGFNQYCFGDYYAQSFVSVGIFPWFSVSFGSGPAVPRYYDPLFVYYSGVNMRRDPMWITHVREEYIVRRDNVAMRPAHTLVEQTRLIRAGGGHERVQVMARPLGDRPVWASARPVPDAGRCVRDPHRDSVPPGQPRAGGIPWRHRAGGPCRAWAAARPPEPAYRPHPHAGAGKAAGRRPHFARAVILDTVGAPLLGDVDRCWPACCGAYRPQ